MEMQALIDSLRELYLKKDGNTTDFDVEVPILTDALKQIARALEST